MVSQTPTKQSFHPALPWLMWGLSAAFYFYEFLLQVTPSVMGQDWMRSFGVSAGTLGNLAATYFYIYATMQIPVGILLDYLGPRRLLAGATTICALGCYLFSTANELSTAYIARGLIGFGSAFAVVGSMKLVANWFPANRFATITGMILTLGMIGAMSGQAPVAAMVDGLGWRDTMLLLSIIGIVLAIAIAIAIRNEPASGPVSHADLHHVPQLSVIQGLLKVLSSPQSWLVAGYGGLMFAPTSAFAALWGVSFLMELYEITRPTAAFIVSLIFLGWAIGSPVVGWLSDFIGKRKPLMFWGSILALFDMVLVLYMPGIPLTLMGLLMFAFGIFSSGFLMSFPLIREISPPSVNATALGFMNTLNMVGGAVLQPVIGIVLDMMWDGTKMHGIHVYQIDHYQFALACLPISIILSLFLLPFIKESYCKSVTS